MIRGPSSSLLVLHSTTLLRCTPDSTTELSRTTTGFVPSSSSLITWNADLLFVDSAITTIPGLSQVAALGDDKLCILSMDSQKESVFISAAREESVLEAATVRRIRKGERLGESCSTDFHTGGLAGAVLSSGGSTAYLVRTKKEENQPYVRRLKNEKTFQTTSLAGVFADSEGAVVVCAGSGSGKIAVFRVGGLMDDPRYGVMDELNETVKSEAKFKSVSRSELHWHSSAVTALALVDENHLVSGGAEGVIVLWRLDQGTASREFRARLGANILCACPLFKIDDEAATSCALLLGDGCVLEVEIPTLDLKRKIRTSIPTDALVVTNCGVDRQDDLAKCVAVVLNGHTPGSVTFVDPTLREDSRTHNLMEKVIDVTGRNAVSNADSEFRWRCENVAFSPSGRVMGCLLGSGGSSPTSLLDQHRRRELRVFFNGVREVLRVPLAIEKIGGGGAKSSLGENQNQILIAVTENSILFADPNERGKVVLFSGGATGEYLLERIFDVSPQAILRVALSDDESCAACFTENGLVRVWDRVTGGLVMSYCLGADSDPKRSGVSFSKGSREIFAWNQRRVEALLQNYSLSFDEGEFELESATASSLPVCAYVLRDVTKGTTTLMKWSGLDEGPSRVEEVEVSNDWQGVEWGGRTVGWILKRANGTVSTRGGSFSSFASASRRNHATPMQGLPVVSSSVNINVVARRKTSAVLSSKTFTEWCREVPSHMLPDTPPQVELLWPTSAPLKRSAQHVNESPSLPRKVLLAETTLSTKHEDKRKKPAIVEDETPEDEAALKIIFSMKN